MHTIAISDGGTDMMTKTFDGRQGTMIDKNFGKLMRRERKKQGMTQAELAEKAGVSTMTIRRYESGDRKPRFEEVLKISDALSINYGIRLTETLPFAVFDMFVSAINMYIAKMVD